MKFVDSIRVKNKYGFSLFEVVVTMAIIAIFIAAASNVFTQKYKRKVALPAHGRFECYYDTGGTLTQRLISENVVVQDLHPTNVVVKTNEAGEEVSEEVPLEYCVFEPIKAASYLVINAVAAGGAGGLNYGGSSGDYRSVFLTTTTHRLKVYPGLGGTFDPSTNTYLPKGGDTFITDQDTDDREVIRLTGGRSSSGDVKFLRNCNISYVGFVCRMEPYCAVDEANRQLKVGYCNTDSQSLSAESVDNLSFSTVLNQYSFLTNEELSSGTISYSKTVSKNSYMQNDAITYYTISADVDGNFFATEQASEFNRYIDGLDVTDGVADVNPRPGNGGAARRNGGHGAVVIAW